MSPDDHAELLRLRERVHEIANNVTVAIGKLTNELHEATTAVKVVEARLEALNEQHRQELRALREQHGSDMRGLRDAIEHNDKECARQFEEQSEDVQALRRGLYTLAFSAVGTAITFALGVLLLLNK